MPLRICKTFTNNSYIAILQIKIILIDNQFSLSANCSFKRYAEQLLGLDGELHGQLVEHILGIAVDDQPHSLLHGNAALVAVEELVLTDL